MSPRQLAFFRQARTDWRMFQLLRLMSSQQVVRRQGEIRLIQRTTRVLPVCHELHYLQMATEKLAKAYYSTPPRGHQAFSQFIRNLDTNPGSIAPLGFANQASLTRWQGSVEQLVQAVENLAPQLADRNNSANPEYPWPRGAEVSSPVDHSFQVEVYSRLEQQARIGLPSFLTILDRMFATMQTAAWHL